MKKFIVLCTLLVAVAAFSVKKLNWDKVHEDDILFNDYKPKQSIEGRIAKGREALPHEFPYQVGIHIMLPAPNPDSPDQPGWCGGALVSNKVVLTAARCLNNTEKATVYLGAHDIQDENEEGRQTFLVTPKDFIIHSGFTEEDQINDIALIILPQEAEINGIVYPVHIPKAESIQDNYEFDIAAVSGWGRTGSSVSDAPSNALRVANLRILNDNSCRSYYPNKYHSTQICVSGMDRTSPCGGDAGDPLVTLGDEESKVVIGLVSYERKEGCQKGYPSVFTRVSAYLDWIKEKTGITGNF